MPPASPAPADAAPNGASEFDPAYAPSSSSATCPRSGRRWRNRVLLTVFGGPPVRSFAVPLRRLGTAALFAAAIAATPGPAQAQAPSIYAKPGQFSATGGAWVSAAVPLEISASAPNGIRRLQVLVDGAVYVDTVFPCDYGYPGRGHATTVASGACSRRLASSTVSIRSGSPHSTHMELQAC